MQPAHFHFLGPNTPLGIRKIELPPFGMAHCAQKAAIEVAEVGKLTVREGNPGDDAINKWIAAMMTVYRKITGKEPATSVGAPSRSNEGIAAGPLI